ncbi:putative ABC transport system permease protein [Tumebacillus sp. BK434]|uniref:ABC transporter permease n=1 Tax=Tumebacillus sp. BK434 TaxID=2512169 RepID=UPI00104F6E4C|nr:FtsX-like permease family protein [Tumebacillus sp. BK434]TCP59686.1 putative ABC transport system permease protein [Tumebacillus sp. BK434]
MLQRIRWAWRNLWRKPLRSGLLLTSTAITAAMLFLSYFFLISVDRSLTASEARFGADVMVVPKNYGKVAEQVMITGEVSPFYMPGSVVDKLRSIPEVQALTPQLYLETFSGTCCQVEGEFPVVAFDPETDFTLKGYFSGAGRDLTSEKVIVGSDAGGKNAIYHLQYKAYRETLKLFGREFQLARVLFPTGTGADRTIYMTLDAARELRETGGNGLKFPKGSVSVVLVKTAPGDEEFVKRQIERQIPEASAVTGTKLRETIERQLFPLRLLSYSMIGVVILMAAIQGMTLFSALVNERMREIGMFRALGAGRWAVYRLLLTESLLASVTGGAVGVFLVAAMLADNQAVIAKAFQLPLLFPRFLPSLLLAGGAVLLTALIGMLAAAVPIRSILRQNPYDAIREGE